MIIFTEVYSAKCIPANVSSFKIVVSLATAKDPLFGRNPWDEIERLDNRRITFQRMKKLVEYEFLTEEEFLSNPLLGEYRTLTVFSV